MRNRPQLCTAQRTSATTGLGLPTSAPGLGPPLPRMHHDCWIDSRLGLAPSHLQRDCARWCIDLYVRVSHVAYDAVVAIEGLVGSPRMRRRATHSGCACFAQVGSVAVHASPKWDRSHIAASGGPVGSRREGRARRRAGRDPRAARLASAPGADGDREARPLKPQPSRMRPVVPDARAHKRRAFLPLRA